MYYLIAAIIKKKSSKRNLVFPDSTSVSSSPTSQSSTSAQLSAFSQTSATSQLPASSQSSASQSSAYFQSSTSTQFSASSQSSTSSQTSHTSQTSSPSQLPKFSQSPVLSQPSASNQYQCRVCNLQCYPENNDCAMCVECITFIHYECGLLSGTPGIFPKCTDHHLPQSSQSSQSFTESSFISSESSVDIPDSSDTSTPQLNNQQPFIIPSLYSVPNKSTPTALPFACMEKPPKLNVFSTSDPLEECKYLIYLKFILYLQLYRYARRI